MPILVNGQSIPEPLIEGEIQRLARDPHWQALDDPAKRAASIRQAAEFSAVNRMLLEQAAANDSRPIDPRVLDMEVESHRLAGGCREAFDDGLTRQFVERQLRLNRITQEFTAKASKPSLSEVQAFYDANRQNFCSAARYHVAHIVKYVNETQTEEQAIAGIKNALDALDTGEEFSAVAGRLSDCPDKGGDLGTFGSGVMVEEFEAAIRDLQPGERTGMFKTPFGYHVAEMRGKTIGGAASFEEVRPDIEKVIGAIMEQREFLRNVGELREKSDIRRVPGPAPAAAAAS